MRWLPPLLLLLVHLPLPARAQDAPAAPPVRVEEGRARVSLSNLADAPQGLGWQVTVRPDPALAEAPIYSVASKWPVAGTLRRLQAKGVAAGLGGILYDNRDRGHSELPDGEFPGLARIVYDEDMRKRRLDYGLAGPIRFSLPVLGNSSTALRNKVLGRSQPRLALSRQGTATLAWQLYAANHIYAYPEHRDHDPERGDRFPANSPFFLISQGSSYTDRALLRAAGMILAALRPETRERAEREGLLAPLVQMIFRRAQAGAGTRERYLSGAAHPTVWSGKI